LARSFQTFRKRQRENKLREKAQAKRERRAQKSKDAPTAGENDPSLATAEELEALGLAELSLAERPALRALLDEAQTTPAAPSIGTRPRED
jgi:hypothetical protein